MSERRPLGRLAIVFSLLLAVPGCALVSFITKRPLPEDPCQGFDGPIESCNDVCQEPFKGKVDSDIGLGEQGTRFANLLRTAWLTQPRFIRPYTQDHPPRGACDWPGPGHAYYCERDDSITFDTDLLNTLNHFAGDMAAVVVVAHEWGHVNQQRTGMLYDEERTPVENELHADCQAGAFAAILQAWGELSRDDISGAFFALCHFGDEEGFFDALGHGDCEVRRNAFMYGYRGAQFEIDALCGKDPVRTVVEMCDY